MHASDIFEQLFGNSSAAGIQFTRAFVHPWATSIVGKAVGTVDRAAGKATDRFAVPSAGSLATTDSPA